LKSALETAVKMEADLVLIQEPREGGERDGTRVHPSFNFIRGVENEPAKCWIAVNRVSKCRVTEIKELIRECGNHVQVVEVVIPGGETIVIANVYDQWFANECLVQKAKWGEIAWQKRVIIAGDMNAHSEMWNPRAIRCRNAVFWEKLIEGEELFVWNSDEVTRSGPNALNHSIIDLILSSPNIKLNWSILGSQAAGSDHELIAWQVLAK